ncbi:unnamed protein product [Discula destructiva]
MPPFSQAAQSVLLKWLNTLQVQPPPTAMIDLADGFVLAQVLQKLEPTYDISELDQNVSSSRQLVQKRNIQSVYKGLFKYQRRQAPDVVPLQKITNCLAIAENPDAQGLSQLTSLFLATFIFGQDEKPRNLAINSLQTDFTPVEQEAMRRIIEEKQLKMQQLKEQASADDDATDRDAGLADEEERLRLIGDLERKVHELANQRKLYADLNTSHEYLQESHQELKATLDDVQGQLEDLKKLHGADESQRVQVLQDKVDEQAALIAKLEEEVDEYQTKQKQLEIDVENYRKISEESQAYKDKYDELQYQLPELERRANAADRYKQKLSVQRNLEQEVTNLKYELDSRKELDDKLAKALLDKSRLQATEKELLVAMATSEQSLGDERSHKEHYKELYEEKVAEYESLQLQYAVLEKHIEELKEMGAGDDMPRSSTPNSANGGLGSLEQELAQTRLTTTNDTSKVKLLEAEVEVLRHGAASASQADSLRRELDRAKAERDIAVKKYEAIFEKHGVAQEQIEALINNMTGEGLVKGLEEASGHGTLASLTSEFYRSVAFNNLRTSQHKAQQELSELENKYRKLEESVQDKDRENLAMKTDCALLEDSCYHFAGIDDDAYSDQFTVDAIGVDRLDALEQLKQSDQLISSSLRSELEALRSKYDSLEIENNLHKSQLLEALVAKEKLSKDKDSESTPVDPVLAEAMQGQKSKMEKMREHLVKFREVTRKSTISASVSSVTPDRSETPVSGLHPVVTSFGSPNKRRASSVLGSICEIGEPSALPSPILLLPILLPTSPSATHPRAVRRCTSAESDAPFVEVELTVKQEEKQKKRNSFFGSVFKRSTK